jgi:hypothetical protein
MAIVCQLGIFLSIFTVLSAVLKVGLHNALKMGGIIGEDPVHPAVDFAEQAVS